MFRIRFIDHFGQRRFYEYSSDSTIEAIKQEYEECCGKGYEEVQVFEVEEHNITSAIINPKTHFIPIKEKISKIRKILSYVHSVAMPYGLSLVKGKPESDMARIKDETREALIMLNDCKPNGDNVSEEVTE